MATKVSFTITKSNKFNGTGNVGQFRPSYSTGQIIFVEDTGKIYLDFHNKRTCYTPDIMVQPVSDGGIKFIGVSSIDPTGPVGLDGTITIGSTTVTPKIGDMVAWNKKEYIFRNGDDGQKWYELGDEDELSWQDDTES